jgi:hypothetical protein
VETEIKYLAPRTYSSNQRGVPRDEARLQQITAAAAQLLAPPSCRHLLVVPELEVGGVRPDFWIGCIDEHNFAKRAQAGMKPCTAPLPLTVALELRRLGGVATINRLAASSRRLGDRSRVLRGIGQLVERGLAVREEEGVRLSPAWVPAQARGVAVEVKVDQWRKALRQIQMWRRFVNGAWMVFPDSYLSSVPRQRPGTRGIGLATVQGEELKVVRRPRLIVGQSSGRTVLEEHLYARWLAEGFDQRVRLRKRGSVRPRRSAARNEGLEPSTFDK